MTELPIFLYLAAFGIVAQLPAIPFSAVGGYFFRFHATLALILVALATAIGRPMFRGTPATPLDAIAEVCLIVFAVMVFVENIVVRAGKRGFPKDALWVPVSIGVPAVIFLAFRTIPDETFLWRSLMALHLLGCAAMLGTALHAMLLGHWYLNNASLSFDHLVRFCRFVLLAAGANLILAGIHAARHWETVRTSLWEFDGMMVGVRVVVGLVAVLGLGSMAYACARDRSNQSATGILYVVVVFSLIGELSSLYLTFERGLPI